MAITEKTATIQIGRGRAFVSRFDVGKRASVIVESMPGRVPYRWYIVDGASVFSAAGVAPRVRRAILSAEAKLADYMGRTELAAAYRRKLASR